MLSDLLQTLTKPLEAEARLGYANSAVVGGLDEYMRTHARRGLDGVLTGEISSSAEFALHRLYELWNRYAAAPAAERAEIVRKSQYLLDKCETENPEVSTPSTPPQSTPVPQPPAPSPEPPELTYLKGVGPKRAKMLEKLGLHTVHGLLYYFPARYEDRRLNKTVGKLEIGEKQSFCATVLYPPQTRQIGKSRRSVTRVRVGDESGRVDLQWWNQPWREKQMEPGTELFIFGKVSEFNGVLQVETPECEVMGQGEAALQVGRIVPVYPATEGLLQSALRRTISHALENFAPQLEEMLPDGVLRQFDLKPLLWSLQQIHFPDDWPDQEAARRRLLFEELILLQVALAQKKLAVQAEAIGVRHEVEPEKIKSEFVQSLPFRLTGAQRRVMNEVRRDLKSARPMNRLLHGDVGSGKTMVAAYALWTAHMTGHQGALLAPTEILAEQHFSVLSRLFKPLGIEVALLEGSLKAKQKRVIQADIAEGRVSVIVGTHALIQEAVEFHKLGICVVDEQHRFGVMQRAALQEKSGVRPDVLVMTATPIPRTMALTIYGDLDVSVLDELPPGRQPIKTVKVKPTQRPRAYKFVLDEVKKGRQAYVVCPLVEESEKLAQLQAATALAERLRQEELKDLRVGLVHGQMSVIERDEQMELFRAGMHDVLVSTTVIEVGVDVPNATVMLIEDAERFGLSQLHQLRGRVGRGEHKSTCVLLCDPKTDEGKARIQVMTKTQDGFEIAEHDLALRGPGEFYGTRQSGLPDFRLANIIRDVEEIQAAREAAFALVQSDPYLELPEHQPLQRGLKRFWGDKLSLVQVS